ncbi:TetR/AcrR family transcriptional regulator [Streptomyces sp. OF3]|uniref:TetR family transcriptional regulator n=1 Tax=Streptomyces alkaliterrae TaxID=2213162 RepID=A0A5P0YWV8_9ACTN|nr:TetR/AcrR family transcriptional regulator [Streptomyces alkaliterrae]MBB1261855.1 TetR/AcrR family transcriptional regulator [Streptomyces alkaliterrae]MQS04771.1 TetR family transcriptional regulator [Streptomyces alkaliterrae]
MDAAILDATRELLARDGYAGLTMDAVAERAGIGKAAIYRRHGTKQEMVFAAAIHEPELPGRPDTGSLVGDLTALVQEIVDHLTSPAASAAVLGLLADVAPDSALAVRFRERFVSRELADIESVLDRAVTRGELPPPPARPDASTVHALVAGPVFALLYLQRTPPNGLAERLAPVVATALTATRSPGG